MTRRAPLPKITECVELQHEQGGARRSSMMLAAYPFVVIAALSLAHIHTRFLAADMTLQIGQMQKVRRTLQLQENRLERDHQSMAADFARLEAVARDERKMRRPDPSVAQAVATVAPEVMEKYMAPLPVKEVRDQTAIARAEAREQSMAGRLVSLLETGQVFASAVRPQ